MAPAKERSAFSRSNLSDLSDFDLEVVSTAHEDLVNLAGPSARYVAAAKRRSKVQEVREVKEVKEVLSEAKAQKADSKPERMSWADMMEEDDTCDWPKIEVATKKITGATENWSWSTAATDQDFDDILEALPEELEGQQKEKAREEEHKRIEREQVQQEKLLRQKEIIQERLRLQQQKEEEQKVQEQIRRIQQEQLRQQAQQEQLRQQAQQEQLRQQQMQQQMRQQQMQQQMLQLQQLQQMQQMQQMQQVPMLVAVPCMAVAIQPQMQKMQPEIIEEEKETKETCNKVVLQGGPKFGQQHRFHQKNTSMGVLSPDARTFTKTSNKGRLSIVCENRVHFSGVVRYAVQFTEGELCSADGVGFILSSDLPCTKNIQKIVSVFANRTGRICVRVHEDVKRCQQRVKCLELGDWLEVISDLEQQQVTFVVWPKDKSPPSWTTISFGDVLDKARGRSNVPRSSCGYLAVVMKHIGVSVNLAS